MQLFPHTIILYNQYGKWSATTPFSSRREAERHADNYFRQPDKDYKRGIVFLDVWLPSYPSEKELGGQIAHDAERVQAARHDIDEAISALNASSATDPEKAEIRRYIDGADAPLRKLTNPELYGS